MAKTRRRKKQRAEWGGKRPGSGRPHLFSGTRVKLSVKITKLAQDLVRQTREKLEPEHGYAASDGAAVEYLIRRATNTPLDYETRRDER